ncbi:MAG: OmpA family protein [Saprospiraceae bacterium]
MKDLKVVILTIATVFFLMLFSPNSYSQYSGSRDAISLNVVGVDYYSLFKDDFLNTDYSTFGVKLGYHRNLVGDLLNLEIPFSVGSAIVLLELNYVSTRDSISGRRLKTSLGGLLQLQLFDETKKVVPYLSAGVVGTYIADEGEWHAEIPLGIGFDFRLKKGAYLQIRPEYRIGLVDDDRSNLNLNVGFKYFLSGEPTPPPPPPVDNDRDKDGVMNSMDECPDVFGVAALNGCPDSDNDGITDGDDACPTEAGIAKFNGCPDTDGDGLADNNDKCPNDAGPEANAGCPYGDSDGDGVTDNIDDCPSLAGMAKFNGCPDSDGDGIADNKDACPKQKGLAQFGGCPDTDKDGIADNDDKCPNEAGPKSNNGCPEVVKEVQEAISFAAKNIQFETNSSRIKSRSYKDLDNVAGILAQYPEYNVSISGHTDSAGNEDTNRRLSEKRAKACLNYLVKKGVTATRMASAGYGESQPIGDNKTSEGRKMNRRVEFSLYKR